jgi:dihydropyrimidine dehydrogenase (NAD+) subunit PreA
MVGLNNIELITDRPLEDNLKEMAEVKKRFPHHALIASLMVETKSEWQEIIRQVEDVGSDGIELNFGCPHGMCERGMGSAVGQEPEVLKKITGWVKEFAKVPVIVKLTPNITDVTVPAQAALEGGADAVSLINTIKSIIQVDIDQFAPYPMVDGKSTNGGYCGPAVKPIALHMVGGIARKTQGKLPISGIGGISNWRDAVEFMLLGAGNVQVCTAVMHYGYRIVGDLIQGLSDYMDQKGFVSTSEFVGKAIPNFTDWGSLDLNFKQIAKIHPEHCIGCNLCVTACHDGAHQCIDLNPEFKMDGKTRQAPLVIEEECVGCNLCSLVCPAPGAISMERT